MFRRLRDGSHVCGSNGERSVGLITCPRQNQIAHSASRPTPSTSSGQALAENARMGHPANLRDTSRMETWPTRRKKKNFLDDLSNSGPAVRLSSEGRATGPPQTYRKNAVTGRRSLQEKEIMPMRKKKVSAIAIKSFALLVVLGTECIGTANQAMAQDAMTPSTTTSYAKMAPVDQYLMTDQSAEIALARSAAPDSIARDAEVQVLGRHGFETAVKGKNGFVCIVGRGWTSAADPDFWNPKVRVPMCVNAAAARSYLLRLAKITELALAGRTLAQVNEAIAAAIAKKELPPMEPGAMCYMMSKEGYGGATLPHWPSHLMFFYSDTDPAIWGANLPGSPVLGVTDTVEHLTSFVVLVQRWSDGTEYREGSVAEHHH